jgi:tellurite methyltransferase
MKASLTPNQIVLEILNYIKSGKVLDLACGQGQDSIYLAKLGFNVTSIDNWEQSINDTKQLAKIHNLDIKTQLVDINNFSSKEKFDIILCNNSLHLFKKSEVINIIESMKTKTNIKGINVITSFTTENPPINFSFLFKENQLRKLYSDWKILYFSEYCSPIKFDGIVKPHSIVELIAKKP